LNRPERLNAISRDLATALLDSLAEYDNDPDLWACIITGAGDKSFSVGADLKDEKHLFDPEKWEAAFVRYLFSIQKPLKVKDKFGKLSDIYNLQPRNLLPFCIEHRFRGGGAEWLPAVA
jgi:hypothetical protein